MSDLKDTFDKTKAELEEKFRNMKNAMQPAIEDSSAKIKEMERSYRIKRETIDVTRPSKFKGSGSRNPVSKTVNGICEIFFSLGFSLREKSGIGTDAADKGICELIGGEQPPVRCICTREIYRPGDGDITHSPVFHELEGIVVDKGVTMADLIGTMEFFAKEMFGGETKIRLRPQHFPHTSPSAEVDIACRSCGGKGCSICRGEGWIEILGAGMIRPEDLEQCGIDSSVYSGFVFGIGVERTAMELYGIDDIGILFENDIRSLKQFK